MDTRKVLMDFFSLHPEYLVLATENHPCHNPDQIDMWEGLFRHVYNGDTPIDVPCNEFPWHRRPGSTDPRWDTLILKSGLGFGKAMDEFLRDYISEIIRVSPIQEAA